jgi:hypothetical protein
MYHCEGKVRGNLLRRTERGLLRRCTPHDDSSRQKDINFGNWPRFEYLKTVGGEAWGDQQKRININAKAFVLDFLRGASDTNAISNK